ncbi:MAG: hypothetical protein C0502_02110 [Opitutus sp.]|nr:hypothetical protein [Opitutus sp.]
MRRPKEIVVLLALLIGAAAFVLWYVVQRRAERRAATATQELGPVAPKPYVDLGRNEGKTIDFSSGQPVVKDSPEDRAALEQGLKEIEAAVKDVSFEAAKKPEPKKP